MQLYELYILCEFFYIYARVNMKPFTLIFFLSLLSTTIQAQHSHSIYDSVDKIEYFQFTHQDTVDASNYNNDGWGHNDGTREWRAWYRMQAYKNFLEKRRVDSLNSITMLFYDSVKHIEYLTFTHQDTIDAGNFNLQCGPCYGHGKEWRAWYRMEAYDNIMKKRAQDSLEANRLRQQRIYDSTYDAQHLKELTKRFGPAIAKKMIKKQLWLGMNDEMVLEEFGEPDDINKVTTAAGSKAVWLYYYQNKYGLKLHVERTLTFKNHILISISE